MTAEDLATQLRNTRRLFSSARIRSHERLLIKKRNALCCPDFPRLPRKQKRRTAQLLMINSTANVAKNSEKSGYPRFF